MITQGNTFRRRPNGENGASLPQSGSSSRIGVLNNGAGDATMQAYSSSVGVAENGLTNTYGGQGSNRLLQNFLTESGLSPSSSHGAGRTSAGLDFVKDEPSISSAQRLPNLPQSNGQQYAHQTQPKLGRSPYRDDGENYLLRNGSMPSTN